MFSSPSSSKSKNKTKSPKDSGPVFNETFPLFLRQNECILTQHEKELAAMLISLGQHHLFSNWEVPGLNDDKKHNFFAQVQLLFLAQLLDSILLNFVML